MSDGLLFHYDTRLRTPLTTRPTAADYHQYLSDGFLKIGEKAVGLCWVINGKVYPIETAEEIEAERTNSFLGLCQDDIIDLSDLSSEIDLDD